MAIYRGTALVSQIVGKLGDNIFQRWKNKNVVKSAESSVANPNSVSQEAVRDALGFTSNRWANVLTAEQKTTWESYARKSPGYKKKPAGIRQLMKGNNGTFFGLNAAIKVNTQLIYAGLLPVDEAPLAKPLPGLAIIDTVSWSGEFLIITWNPLAFEAGAMIRIWIDSQQELFHKQILLHANVVDGTAQQQTVRGVAGAPLSFASIGGSTVLLQLDCINPSGAISRAGNTVLFRIPGLELRRPSGDVAVAWTPFPAAPPTNFDKVNEVVHDDAATFVTGVPVGIDIYSLPATSILAGSTIDWVSISGWFQDAFAGPGRILFDDGVAVTGIAIPALPVVWGFVSTGPLALNPRTAAPWLLAEIIALKIGIENLSVPVFTECTQLYVEVQWSPPGVP